MPAALFAAPGKYTYAVLPGNNAELIRRVLQRRECWQATADYDTQFNFKWKQTVKGLHMEQLNQIDGLRQMVNHMEGNTELCTKIGLFKYVFCLFFRYYGACNF